MASTWLPVLLIGAGCVLRVHHAVARGPNEWMYSDALRHWLNAEQVWHPAPFSATDPIGYQLWLWMVQRATHGSTRGLAVYGSVLSVATVLFWTLFAISILRSRAAALWYGAALASLPSWIAIFGYFFNETLLLPLLGLALWLSFRPQRESTPRLALVALVWAAAICTRVIALPFALVAIGYHLPRLRRPWLGVAAVAAVWTLVFAPVAYRNYKLIRVPAPFWLTTMNEVYWKSSAREVDLHLFSDREHWDYEYFFISPSVDEHPLRPFSDWKMQRSGKISISVDVDHGMEDWNWALNDTPVEDPMGHLQENIIFFVLGDSWPDRNLNDPVEAAGLRLRWMWPIVILLGVAAAIFFSVKNRSLHVVPVLTLMSAGIGFFSPLAVMEGRFRKPLEGVFLLTVVWAVEQAWFARQEAWEESTAVSTH